MNCPAGRRQVANHGFFAGIAAGCEEDAEEHDHGAQQAQYHEMCHWQCHGYVAQRRPSGGAQDFLPEQSRGFSQRRSADR